MSIKLSLGTTGMKEVIGTYIREHSSEIAIVGIMTTVLVGVAALATGDITHALAMRHRG
jgi:succinate dehydrogenase hydrophobic anchor subunit